MTRTRKLVIATAVAVAVGGGGAAFAGSRLGPPEAERDAVIADAAWQLGIEPQALEDALGKALENRVDAAVEAGRLSEERGERLKERIRAGDAPFLRRPGLRLAGGPFGRGERVRKLEVAAGYLDLSKDQLRERLRDGQSLAGVARDEGKPVDGLVDALEAALRERLDRAVEDGRLTEERRDAVLERLEGRIEALVERELRGPLGHRFRGGGPPAWAPSRS